jgi:DNA modification methylase
MIEINKNYNESNLDTMAKMPDCFVDLTITSPPYDGLRTYNGYSFPFEDIAKELYRITKQGGVVVWIVNDSTKNGSESLTSFRQAIYFKEIGFNVHDTMIYAKNNPIPTGGDRYGQQLEYMFVFSKGKPKTFNPIQEKCIKSGQNKTISTRGIDGSREDYKKNIVKNTKKKNNIWFYNIGNYCTTKDSIAFKHPAIFPEKLVEDHIISWSNENDLVYDPFMGSGTTAKMSIINNRNWIGSEISSEYCNIINERIKNIQKELSFK